VIDRIVFTVEPNAAMNDDRFTVFERWSWGPMLVLSFAEAVYALATAPGPCPTERIEDAREQ
jgi:hypothetical protein